MLGEGLPRECDDCEEDVAGLYDHELGCGVAARLAQREIERIESKPQGWDFDGDEETIERCREYVEAGREP